tara:strand:+ start:2266 stop:2712 length:447 start_codon:yes stop_codon:yes gene_type:complete
VIKKQMLKKIKLISLLILSILFFSTNKSYANLNNVSCENPITNSKTNIVYGNNFAKEEMSPNIWLFFQKISLVNNNLNLISIDDDKPIRQWQINLVSGKATLTPMFDPSSNWLCLNIDRELKKLEEQYKSGAMSGYEFEVAKKKLLKK